MATSPSTPPGGIEVFYSYTHADEPLRDQLEQHLSLLKRQGVIAGWHDRRITAGTEWAGAIDAHLQRAHIILLLIRACLRIPSRTPCDTSRDHIIPPCYGSPFFLP